MMKRVFSLVFFLSGLAGLSYQVVWQRLLAVHYGVGAVATTTVICLTLLGLGFGSVVGGSLCERRQSLVRDYILIEASLAAFALLSLPILKFLGESTSGSPLSVATALMAAFLLVPTCLMGMTLPYLVQILSAFTGDYLKTVSWLYFVNTLGAAFGALFSAYVVISFFGLDWAIFLGAVLNLCVAAMVGWWARRAPIKSKPPNLAGAAPPLSMQWLNKQRLPLIYAFTVGFIAIAYELIWFRIIGVLVKASPYAFATVLAVYLLGVAMGSYLLGRKLSLWLEGKEPLAFYALQVCLAAVSVGTMAVYIYLTKHSVLGLLTDASFSIAVHPLPQLPSGSLAERLFQWFAILDIFAWPALFVFVPCLMMGASFPLLAKWVRGESELPGRSVAWVYWANTLGNVAGGLCASFVLLPWLGTELSLLTLACIGFAFVIPLFGAWGGQRSRKSVYLGAIFWGMASLVALWLLPGKQELYLAMHGVDDNDNIRMKEGVEGVVLAVEEQGRFRNYIGGLNHGGRPGYGFYQEALDALRYSGAASRVLVIGFGTGSVVEAALASEQVESLLLVELNETLMDNLATYPVFQHILGDPRIELVFDDGRRHLHHNSEPFDLILVDPLRSTTAQSNNLYSKEFFELVKENLSDDGVMMVWLDEHNVLPKTLATVFEHVRWYHYYALVSSSEMIAHEERFSQALGRFTEEQQAGILQMTGRYLGDRQAILSATEAFPINTDWRPHCEYYLGLGAFVADQRLGPAR